MSQEENSVLSCEESELSEDEDTLSEKEYDSLTEGSGSSDESDGSISGGSDSESAVCPICLAGMNRQDLGTPESCDHLFCLECIVEWSSNVNTCPVDRQVFNLIFAKHSPDGEIYKKIPVIDRSLVVDDEQDATVEDMTLCQVCNLGDREDRLLLCDGCDYGYHTECLTPPLHHVPRGSWFCHECQPNQNIADESETASISESDEETVGINRILARTITFERVRARITQRRLRAPRNRIFSSDDEETALVKSVEKKKKSKSSLKKPRAKGKKRIKRKRPKFSKSKVAKGKKRRCKRRKRCAVKKTNKVKSVKGRLADRLGMSKPPVGRTLPVIRPTVSNNLANQRLELSVEPLKIMGTGHDPFISWSDDENNSPRFSSSGASTSVARMVTYPIGQRLSKAAIKSSRPILLSTPKSNLQVKKPCTVSSFDLLGDIMLEQNQLLSLSKDVTIKKDGSLKLNDNLSQKKIVKPIISEKPLPSQVLPQNQINQLNKNNSTSVGRQTKSTDDEVPSSSSTREPSQSNNSSTSRGNFISVPATANFASPTQGDSDSSCENQLQIDEDQPTETSENHESDKNKKPDQDENEKPKDPRISSTTRSSESNFNIFSDPADLIDGTSTPLKDERDYCSFENTNKVNEHIVEKEVTGKIKEDTKKSKIIEGKHIHRENEKQRNYRHRADSHDSELSSDSNEEAANESVVQITSEKISAKSRNRRTRSRSKERHKSSKHKKRSRSSRSPHNSRKKGRSSSKERQRSHSKDRKYSRSKEIKNSRSNNKKRSRSKERKRSRSKEKKYSHSRDKKRSRSKEKKSSKSKTKKRSHSRDNDKSRNLNYSDNDSQRDESNIKKHRNRESDKKNSDIGSRLLAQSMEGSSASLYFDEDITDIVDPWSRRNKLSDLTNKTSEQESTHKSSNKHKKRNHSSREHKKSSRRKSRLSRSSSPTHSSKHWSQSPPTSSSRKKIKSPYNQSMSPESTILGQSHRSELSPSFNKKRPDNSPVHCIVISPDSSPLTSPRKRNRRRRRHARSTSSERLAPFNVRRQSSNLRRDDPRITITVDTDRATPVRHVEERPYSPHHSKSPRLLTRSPPCPLRPTRQNPSLQNQTAKDFSRYDPFDPTDAPSASCSPNTSSVSPDECELSSGKTAYNPPLPPPINPNIRPLTEVKQMPPPFEQPIRPVKPMKRNETPQGEASVAPPQLRSLIEVQSVMERPSLGEDLGVLPPLDRPPPGWPTSGLPTEQHPPQLPAQALISGPPQVAGPLLPTPDTSPFLRPPVPPVALQLEERLPLLQPPPAPILHPVPRPGSVITCRPGLLPIPLQPNLPPVPNSLTITSVGVLTSHSSLNNTIVHPPIDLLQNNIRPLMSVAPPPGIIPTAGQIIQPVLQSSNQNTVPPEGLALTISRAPALPPSNLVSLPHVSLTSTATTISTVVTSPPPPLPQKAILEMEHISKLLNVQGFPPNFPVHNSTEKNQERVRIPGLGEDACATSPGPNSVHFSQPSPPAALPLHGFKNKPYTEKHARPHTPPSPIGEERLESEDMDVASPCTDDDMLLSFSPPPIKSKNFDTAGLARGSPARAKKFKRNANKKPHKRVTVNLEGNHRSREEDIPSSAARLEEHEKLIKKLNRQERVVEEVKLSIKPHYGTGKINKEEYKDILRKVVPKICHTKSDTINPEKIRSLVIKYVEHKQQLRKYLKKKNKKLT